MGAKQDIYGRGSPCGHKRRKRSITGCSSAGLFGAGARGKVTDAAEVQWEAALVSGKGVRK